MVANVSILWAHLIKVYQGVHSATQVHDVRAPWEQIGNGLQTVITPFTHPAIDHKMGFLPFTHIIPIYHPYHNYGLWNTNYLLRLQMYIAGE